MPKPVQPLARPRRRDIQESRCLVARPLTFHPREVRENRVVLLLARRLDGSKHQARGAIGGGHFAPAKERLGIGGSLPAEARHNHRIPLEALGLVNSHQFHGGALSRWGQTEELPNAPLQQIEAGFAARIDLLKQVKVARAIGAIRSRR